jgi:hypothetical protein
LVSLSVAVCIEIPVAAFDQVATATADDIPRPANDAELNGLAATQLISSRKNFVALVLRFLSSST